MKTLIISLFAIALIFRVTPICAAPVAVAITQGEAAAAMPGCEDMTIHSDKHPTKQQGQKDKDAARACHVCAYSLISNATLTKPAIVPAIVVVNAIEQLTGGALKPPIPPPRYAHGISI